MTQPAPHATPTLTPLLRVRVGTGVGEGWLLPASSVMGTAVPGVIAPSAHAPEGILGITGLRGQVYTVIDMRQLLIGERLASPQAGWLSLVATGVDAVRWGLLWADMPGMAPVEDWSVLDRPIATPAWVARVWRTPSGERWFELDVAVFLARWGESTPSVDEPAWGSRGWRPDRVLQATTA